jgi:hypothetical protein
VSARPASTPGWTPQRASGGIHAERAADWGVRDFPEKHSATKRNMFAGGAAYRNWALKSPSKIMSAPTRERFKRKRPRRGAGSAGVTYDT